MPDAAHPLNLTGHALSPGAQRSWWLREALDHEDARPCPPLAADAKADVVVVGGGFSGLWTAYFLTERAPNLGVVVLEQDICGGGPSGRNGGFASGWWDELGGLVTLYGPEPAVRACRAITASIDSIGEFCSEHGVDAWYRRGGYMYAITAAAHERLRDEMVDLVQEVGAPHEMRALGSAEVWARWVAAAAARAVRSIRCSRTTHARSRRRPKVSASCFRPSPTCPSKTRGAGPSTSLRRTCQRSDAPGRAMSTTPWGIRATGWRRRTW